MPAVFATNRCRPGWRRSAVDHDAFRVTVVPVEVTYTSSRPARSTAFAPTLVTSANSSDADAPPVCTSETRSVETGHDTTPSELGAGPEPAANAAPATDSTTVSAASAAARVRSTDLDLRAGSHRGRAGRLATSSRRRSPGDRLLIT